MRFWDILREFMWLCESVCNLFGICYGCYTESKSYGYAIVYPFGRSAPSVLLRSFRYAKLRLRALPCAQDDTWPFSWSRMRVAEGVDPYNQQRANIANRAGNWDLAVGLE